MPSNHLILCRPLLLLPPIPLRIRVFSNKSTLDNCERGNSAAWWRLNTEMTLKPDSTHYGDELESDLTVLPGWKSADAVTRARLIEVARRYVLEQDPDEDTWLGTNILHRQAFAGYSALRLLLQEAPRLLSAIPEEAWRRWAPIGLAYPTSSAIGEEKPHHELVKLAYHYAPSEIIDTLMILIDQENREHDHIFFIRKLESCWDDHLASALVTKVNDEGLKPECMGDLLRALLEHGIDQAEEFARSLISLLPSL